jgi:hypothetical protein
MISEIETDLPAPAVIEEARRFFTDEGAFHSATIIDESDTHLTLGMFRSRLAISASPGERGRTRVRVSTLRRNDVVGRFLAFIETGGSGEDTAETAESA